MADSSNEFVFVDMERIFLGGKEHHVRTSRGSVSVIVYGDRDKPAQITYPDLALNCMSCFQGLFFCPEAAYLLGHNFCIYHISPPGHELGAAPICPSDPVPSADDLADQIIEAWFSDVHGGDGWGRVLGLILLSPLCRAPSWIEWFYNKSAQGVSASTVLQQEIAELDIVEACRRLLNERHSTNFLRFLQAINKRPDLPHGLKRLKCGSLIFVEENTPFHYEALHMTSKLDRRYSALVEVQAYGSMVTEEQPHAMLIRMEYFFMGYGFYRPCYLNGSPRSPLTPSCIAPEILSPESMCLKLKPIKTRVKLDVQVEENGRI